MNIEPGLVVVIVAMALFYLRIAFLRGRKRRLAREAEAAYRRARSRGKNVENPEEANKRLPTYQVSSWWLVGLGGILMLGGLVMRTNPAFIPSDVTTYWWGVTTLGVLVFAFSLK